MDAWQVLGRARRGFLGRLRPSIPLLCLLIATLSLLVARGSRAITIQRRLIALKGIAITIQRILLCLLRNPLPLASEPLIAPNVVAVSSALRVNLSPSVSLRSLTTQGGRARCRWREKNRVPARHITRERLLSLAPVAAAP